MGKFVTEFKQFAVKGNAIELAIGVIIGAAFGKMITSIVEDIIMPPIGWLIGGVNFADLKITLPAVDTGFKHLSPATINYGNFIQAVINFIIIALCIFLTIKGISKWANKKAEEPAAPPSPSNEEKLLSDIRDLLKNK